MIWIFALILITFMSVLYIVDDDFITHVLWFNIFILITVFLTGCNTFPIKAVDDYLNNNTYIYN